MISVLLYGRNDNYGYNLPKRAALSLNGIAELLDDADDEIVFVDYNTPDDFPSFPEAIADTLTARARRLLRVLRVRPAQHRRFAARSHLLALEPVARNVALRRSNPANRWVLSTNTDMIFVPHADQSLSAIAAGLADGYYHLPRMEVPESLWESLDRMDPAGSIAALRRWGEMFHLNEIVESGIAATLFDAPGDFQLMLRQDLLTIGGFDEAMLLGWHVDTNIAQRLALLRGPTGRLDAALFGYHCDHTRQVTPAHRADAVENDWRRFVLEVDRAEAPGQPADWGLADEAVEELRLESGLPGSARALAAVLPGPMATPATIAMSDQSFHSVSYAPARMVVFLADTLASYPRGTVLGWVASRADLLALFLAAWQAQGFTGAVLVLRGAPGLPDQLPAGAAWAERHDVAARADVMVLDFGLPPGCETVEHALPPALDFVAAQFALLVRAERRRLARLEQAAPRRFIALNAVRNRFETLVAAEIAAARAPLATRIRQGVLRPKPTRTELLSLLDVGRAGRRVAGGIGPLPFRRGHVFSGPYLDLLPGRWRLHLEFHASVPGLAGPVKLEGLADGASRGSQVTWLGNAGTTFDFVVPDHGDDAPSAMVEVVASTVGLLFGRFTAAWIDRMGGVPA